MSRARAIYENARNRFPAKTAKVMSIKTAVSVPFSRDPAFWSEQSHFVHKHVPVVRKTALWSTHTNAQKLIPQYWYAVM